MTREDIFVITLFLSFFVILHLLLLLSIFFYHCSFRIYQPIVSLCRIFQGKGILSLIKRARIEARAHWMPSVKSEEKCLSIYRTHCIPRIENTYPTHSDVSQKSRKRHKEPRGLSIQIKRRLILLPRKRFIVVTNR